MFQMRQDEEDQALAKRQFREHVLVVLLILFAMWTVEMVQHWLDLRFYAWGLFPRTAKGLLGLLTMPFLHSGFDHLMANSFGMTVLSMGLLHFYPKVSTRVFLYAAFWSALLVWIFARPSYHIGASAVVYALSAFLFVSGILRRDKKSLGAALVVAFLFGASVWGMLPLQVGISWEGHSFGALTGSILAFRYKNIDLPPRYIEDDEEMWETHHAPVVVWNQDHAHNQVLDAHEAGWDALDDGWQDPAELDGWDDDDGDDDHFRQQFDDYYRERND